MQQPREFRILGWVGGLAFLITAVAFTTNLIASTSRRLEPNAVNKIKDLCGFHAECKVRMGDLFPGDWDALYSFGAGATQEEIDAALGKGKLRALSAERGMLLVLTRNGQILEHEFDEAGGELPLPNQLEFLDGERNCVMHGRFTPDTWLRASVAKVQPNETRSDTYYILTPDER